MSYTRKLIAEIKKEKAISSYRVGKIIGVSAQMISNWENGQSEASARHLLKLMMLGNVSSEDALIGLEEVNGQVEDAYKSIGKIDEFLSSPEKYKQAGFTNLSLIIMTASVSTLALKPFLKVYECILC